MFFTFSFYSGLVFLSRVIINLADLPSDRYSCGRYRCERYISRIVEFRNAQIICNRNNLGHSEGHIFLLTANIFPFQDVFEPDAFSIA